jgi:hypothetical protein
MIPRKSARGKTFLQLCKLLLGHVFGPTDMIREDVCLAVYVPHRESELLNVCRAQLYEA